MANRDAVESTSCCFCGGEIAGSDHDPTYLMVGTKSEVTKTWWCHLDCFNARLPDMPTPWSIYDIERDRQ